MADDSATDEISRCRKNHSDFEGGDRRPRCIAARHDARPFGSNQVASIAAVLGGIVSLESKVSTLRQTLAAASAAEALRSDLIGRIDLRVVGDRAMKRIDCLLVQARAAKTYCGGASLSFTEAPV